MSVFDLCYFNEFFNSIQLCSLSRVLQRCPTKERWRINLRTDLTWSTWSLGGWASELCCLGTFLSPWTPIGTRNGQMWINLAAPFLTLPKKVTIWKAIGAQTCPWHQWFPMWPFYYSTQYLVTISRPRRGFSLAWFWSFCFLEPPALWPKSILTISKMSSTLAL